MSKTRRAAALELSEDLLEDIELARIPAPDLIKKASRLARLTDDLDAMEWLSFEISGYQAPLSTEAVDAARRSHREAPPDDDTEPMRYWTTSLSKCQADVETGRLHLQAAADAPVSISSANPHQVVAAPSGNMRERSHIRAFIASQEELIGKVIGAVHAYVTTKQIELRFGTAAEGAFDVIRGSVDAKIAELAPTAALKFASAFENAASDNSEDWANAASACRRLLKAVADQLQPAGPPFNGRPMTDDKYINRLIRWIEAQPSAGSTIKEVIVADLADFGRRIDAFDNAGHKGAHSETTRQEAARFITGTYLLIGDILNLSARHEIDTRGTDL